MTTVVILQSNYIPWRGYFDLMRRADHFVFYDDVQYTKNDWRNRNRIIAPAGPQWLTIPVQTGGKFGQTIAETMPVDARWMRKHLAALQAGLARGRHFTAIWPKLRDWFDEAGQQATLSGINQVLIRAIMKELGLRTRLHQSAEVDQGEGQTARLVRICQALGAKRYLSGPAARSYLQESRFAAAEIAVDWMEYPAYPTYTQSNGSYDPKVSVLDCLAWLPADQIFEGARP